MKELEKLQNQLEEKIKRVAVLEERGRIMDEIGKTNLPLEVWSLIKNIINPKD